MSTVINHLFEQTKIVAIPNPKHRLTPDMVRSKLGDLMLRADGEAGSWWQQEGKRAPFRIMEMGGVILVAWLPPAHRLEQLIAFLYPEAQELPLPDPTAPEDANTLLIEMLTPYSQGRGAKKNETWKGRPAIDFFAAPDMTWLLPVTVYDLSHLSMEHAGPMERRPEKMLPYTQQAQKKSVFELVSASGSVIRKEHHSRSTGRTIKAHGWVGLAQYEGTPEDVARWYPWLIGASIWGIGQGTTWGNATIRVTAMYNPMAGSSEFATA
jgi:hypothetical protein